MGFKDEMGEFDDEFEEAKNAPRRGGATLPDGRHQVYVTEARMEHDETDDTYTVVVKFQNNDGAIRKWYNMDHEVGRSIWAQDSKDLGYEGRLSETEEWLESEAPIGMLCEIGVKTKPGTERDFTNVYLNRVLGKHEIPEFDEPDAGGNQFVPAGADPPDDDIPF